jgi:hypothetical protein
MSEAVIHSPIGASSCERYWNCPGSIILCEGLPPEKPSFYAAEGTAAHSIGERYLRQGIPVDNMLLGEIITVDGFGIEVTEEMLEAVEVYVDTTLGLLKTHRLKSNRLSVEVGFSLSHLDPEAFGTGDAMVHVPYIELIVLDYKHGKGHAVETQDNKQTLFYGLGGYYSLPKDERNEIERITTAIVQPRCSHPGGAVRYASYTIDQLLEFEDGLRNAIGRVRRRDTTLKAGPHCKFCPARSTCSEARADVERLAQLEFADIDDGELPIDPKTLSPAELANLLQHIPRIRDWCDSVSKYAHSEANRGVEIPGYQLATRTGSRKWKNEKKVIEELDLEYGRNLYGPRKLLSPTQMERLLPKQERHRLNSLWEKPEAGSTLIRIERDRARRLPSAISDFIDLDI